MALLYPMPVPVHPGWCYNKYWDFSDGTTMIGTLTPAHNYCDNNVFTVMLTVTDTTSLSASDTLVMTVANVAPAVTIR